VGEEKGPKEETGRGVPGNQATSRITVKKIHSRHKGNIQEGGC